MKLFTNNVIKVLKRIIYSFLVINCYNFICGNYLIFIPVNILTILIIAVFGIPGIITINLIYYLV